jgi:hypothetical protein
VKWARVPQNIGVVRIRKPDGRFGRYNSLRLPGHDYGNTTDEYFITLTTLGRKPYFADVVLAKKTTSLLLDLHFDGIVQIFAFCLMPDHLHTLVRLAKSGWTLDGALHCSRANRPGSVGNEPGP